MRGTIDGLPTARPLGELLPSVFADDPFSQRFTAGLDEVLAPVLSALDNFDSYLDPELAPDDFVDWLATWVALDLQERWSTTRRRRLVSTAVALHRRRGTRSGLAALIETVVDGRVEIDDSGGCVASESADTPLPGADVPELRVRLYVNDPARIDVARLNALIAANKPVHLPHALQILVEEATR